MFRCFDTRIDRPSTNCLFCSLVPDNVLFLEIGRLTARSSTPFISALLPHRSILVPGLKWTPPEALIGEVRVAEYDKQSDSYRWVNFVPLSRACLNWAERRENQLALRGHIRFVLGGATHFLTLWNAPNAPNSLCVYPQLWYVYV